MLLGIWDSVTRLITSCFSMNYFTECFVQTLFVSGLHLYMDFLTYVVCTLRCRKSVTVVIVDHWAHLNLWQFAAGILGSGGKFTANVTTINFNPILHTTWLESHALTLKNNTAKYYFNEKSSFLHTFLKFSPESRTIQVGF